MTTTLPTTTTLIHHAQKADITNALRAMSAMGNMHLVMRLVINIHEAVNLGDTNHAACDLMLHHAAQSGDGDGVKKALAMGADVNMLVQGETVLHRTVWEGRLTNVSGTNDQQRAAFEDVLVTLLDAGANVHQVNAKNVSVLAEAVGGGNVTMVQRLLEKGDDPNGNDGGCFGFEERMRLVNRAVRGGDPALVRVLVVAGGCPTRCYQEDERTWSVLHEAVAFGWEENTPGAMEPNKAIETNLNVIRTLIDVGVPVDVVDNNGSTPLHWAAHGGNIAIVNLLLEAGASINAMNDHHQTPYDVALAKGNTNVMVLLEKTLLQNKRQARDIQKSGQAPTVRL